MYNSTVIWPLPFIKTWSDAKAEDFGILFVYPWQWFGVIGNSCPKLPQCRKYTRTGMTRSSWPLHLGKTSLDTICGVEDFILLSVHLCP